MVSQAKTRLFSKTKNQSLQESDSLALLLTFAETGASVVAAASESTSLGAFFAASTAFSMGCRQIHHQHYSRLPVFYELENKRADQSIVHRCRGMSCLYIPLSAVNGAQTVKRAQSKSS